ncbi:hypothetical protein LTR04_001921 [Oleoguttula sp. CCFEE 6159]|nr:hypothetical protein LTR04_001921 [Oleoguttula sp. CCFEE 6159]
MAPKKDKRVVVIGAGIIGLQSALFLLEAGYDVTIMAEFWPGDESVEYCSPWAGAHWRTHAKTNEKELCQWDLETYDYWTEIIREEKKLGEKTGKSGLGVSMISQSVEDYKPLWWSTHVQSFQHLNPSTTPPNVTFAISFTSIAVNVPQHLSHLLQRIRNLGGTLIKHKLPTASGLVSALSAAETRLPSSNGIGDPSTATPTPSPVHAFVNATAMGARTLCADTSLYPIRGQTVLVRGEAAAIRTRHGTASDNSPYIAYCIPRPGSGTTILGGTNARGMWDGQADAAVTASILANCKPLVPELRGAGGEFEVLSAQVGLRPAREGGPRCEVEVLEDGEGRRRRVVHCYGHAGAGFQNSVGAARKVVRLVGGLD